MIQSHRERVLIYNEFATNLSHNYRNYIIRNENRLYDSSSFRFSPHFREGCDTFNTLFGK